MFIWIFFALIVIIAIVGMGMMRERDRVPARTRLNNQGWPRPFSRDGHRRKEEE